ncbi:MAG: hypothetical protein ACN6OP_24680, partial [Pseudomonadales bacterium]
TRRPQAFYFGALAMREREADRMASYRGAPRTNDPADDTVRRPTDLRRPIGRMLTPTTEVRPSGDGHYFTPDVGYSFIRDIGARDAGRVMPVQH